MNYWNKERKRTSFNPKNKRTNWNQSLRSTTKVTKPKKIRKSLQYLLILKNLTML